jgi:hypothetical protein
VLMGCLLYCNLVIPLSSVTILFIGTAMTSHLAALCKL